MPEIVGVSNPYYNVNNDDKKYDKQYLQDTSQLEEDNKYLNDLLAGVKNGNEYAIKEVQDLSIFETSEVNNYNADLVRRNNNILEEAKEKATQKEQLAAENPYGNKLETTNENIQQIKAILSAQGDTDITDADIYNYLNNQ